MKRYFITGGCGFIGSNLTASLLADGHHVTVFDNLSRAGTEKNLNWLQGMANPNLNYVKGDIRDFGSLRGAFEAAKADCVFHTAGQVAVTTSVVNPREDFEINALGTLNMLEAVRLVRPQTTFFFTSTNKVYGGMEDVEVIEQDGHYAYRDLPLGVPESRLLDFHSPYGCSKGTADQYVRDYARIYGIPAVVFRMSCQFGPRQFGNEDQGWVVHFIIAAHRNRPINIYGDGKQVRDILFIEDLVRAFRTAEANIGKTKGHIFNIGGGPDNVISLLELVAELESLTGHKIPLNFSDWRPGDQPVYVSDIRLAAKDFGWQPRITKLEGVRRLLDWVRGNENLFD